MENTEILVTEDVTENVDANTEEIAAEGDKAPKTYTEDEVNQIVGKRLARNTNKLTKNFEREKEPYNELIDVLKAGTGKENISDITEMFRNHYQSRGVQMSNKAEYSAKDIEILASAEAQEYINGEIEDAIEEAERLNAIGAENMSAKEKALFVKITDHIKKAKENDELERMGVDKSIYTSEEFKNFAKNFNDSVPVSKIYEIYASTKPKKEIKTAGSMKNETSHSDNAVKEYYTPEEARRFTKEDYDKCPELYKAVCNSMAKWK